MSEDQIKKAQAGLPRSAGGLNVSDIKRILGISGVFSRSELERRLTNSTGVPKSRYFKQPVTISDAQQRWCRCILHVAKKQPDWCLDNPEENAGIESEGRKCYNPYAVCSKSVKGKRGRECFKYLNLQAIPRDERESLLRLHHKSM